MSNVSIYEKNWTDLVFEHRNKEYGAYQLRNENARTTMLAFFVGLLFIFSLYGSWMLLSSFGEKPVALIEELPIIDKIVTVDLTVKPPVAKPIAPKTEPAHSQPPKVPNLSHAVVAITTQVRAEVPQNNDIKTPTNSDSDLPIGTDITVPASTPVNVIAAVPDTRIRTNAELDRLPEYPGGMKKFYEYVGNSIEKSELEDSNSISVIMGFVIEKDGSMSDIRVLRGSDKRLEKEAIRVLKSMKVKWSPGYSDGDKVRTQYTLPIKVTN
jgi:protein TonB